MDGCEAPVSVGCDDRRDKLSKTESSHECRGRAFHEEEAMRTGDENQSLRDDGDLEVDDHVKLTIIGLHRGRLQMDMEFTLEEGGLHDNDNQCNAKERDSSEYA